ncbi:hypothetical protein EMCRGX_G010749 [Ephydatia muelleri]
MFLISVIVVYLIAEVVVPPVRGATLNVTLTPSRTAIYNESNPLLVTISDTIRFSCSGSVSNVIILASLQQWQSCDATTGGPPFLWAYCLTNTSIKTVTIIHQSNSVAGTFSFDEGQDYYLASFSDGTLNGAVNTAYSGGECSSGVKMVIRVRASTTTPSSTVSTATTMDPVTMTTTHPPITSSSEVTSSPGSSNSTSQEALQNSVPMRATPTSVCLVLCAVLAGILRR